MLRRPIVYNVYNIVMEVRRVKCVFAWNELQQQQQMQNKTSPQAKRHKPSLLLTFLAIFTFITRHNFPFLSSMLLLCRCTMQYAAILYDDEDDDDANAMMMSKKAPLSLNMCFHFHFPVCVFPWQELQHQMKNQMQMQMQKKVKVNALLSLNKCFHFRLPGSIYL